MVVAERLLAAIAAKEAKALRVKADWRQVGQTGVIAATDNGRNPEECANGNWAGIAEFIVDNDPAAVLRRCASDRAAVNRYVTLRDRQKNFTRRTSDGERLMVVTCLSEASTFVRLIASGYGISTEEAAT